jgi:site-specific recombinase XerD
MLRHSCGYYLADKGTDLRTMQDYLGHRDPKHTAHYTRVAGHRFEGLWRYPRATHCGRFLNKKRPRAED